MRPHRCVPILIQNMQYIDIKVLKIAKTMLDIYLWRWGIASPLTEAPRKTDRRITAQNRGGPG